MGIFTSTKEVAAEPYPAATTKTFYNKAFFHCFSEICRYGRLFMVWYRSQDNKAKIDIGYQKVIPAGCQVDDDDDNAFLHASNEGTGTTSHNKHRHQQHFI